MDGDWSKNQFHHDVNDSDILEWNEDALAVSFVNTSSLEALVWLAWTVNNNNINKTTEYEIWGFKKANLAYFLVIDI